MANKFGPLATQRIQAIVDEFLALPDIPGGRIGVDRVPEQEALNGEILARIKFQIIAADVIQINQRAVIHQPEQINTYMLTVPKLKHGQLIDEAMIEILRRVEANVAVRRDLFALDNYIARQIRNILAGIM